MTVSHHFLRRTARERADAIKVSQQKARQGLRAEIDVLRVLGISTDDHVFVEKAWRGPFRWRVVAQ